MKNYNKVNRYRINKIILITVIIILLLLAGFLLYTFVTRHGITAAGPYKGHLKNYSTGLTAEESYRQDLKFIYQEIKENYVDLEYKENLFHFDWDERFEFYSRKLETVTSKKDFYKICNEYIATLKDGHVWFEEYNTDPDLRFWAPYSKGFVFAFELRYIQGHTIVVSNRLNGSLNGYELVSIEGIPITQILDTMLKYCYQRGNDDSARAYLLRSGEFYRYFLYEFDTYPQALTFELINKEGLTKTITIETNTTFDGNYDNYTNINLGNTESSLPVVKLLDETGYIRIDTFNGNVQEIVTAFQDTVNTLKEAKVKGAVLDLRYNGGGNESFRKILSYLTEKDIVIANYHYRKSPRFYDIFYLRPLLGTISGTAAGLEAEKGYTNWYKWTVQPSKEPFLTNIPVAVLCNESIFSSTNDFVYTCLKYNLAKVVGNTVPLSGNGLSTQIVLPSREYVISYCFFESMAPDGSPFENVILKPDITVEQSYDDLLKNRDTQLNAALDYINKAAVK